MRRVIVFCDVCGYADSVAEDSPSIREKGPFELSICPACREELTIPAAEPAPADWYTTRGGRDGHYRERTDAW